MPLAAAGLEVRRGGLPVIRGLDMSVHTGEVLAVRGPSGVGKTSLLGVLCGLLAPAAGSVQILGREIVGLREHELSKIRLTAFGVVFQGDELLPDLTLLENVTLPLRLRPGSGRTRDYTEAVQPVLERLGIGALGGRFPDEVSGGQLQRAAVARAVVHEPAIVLADEPTESLDASAAAAAMELLVTVVREQGASAVIVTHDEHVARRCDRELHLEPEPTPITSP